MLDRRTEMTSGSGQLEAMAFLTRWRIGERNRTPRPVLCLGLGHGIVLGPCRRPRSLLPSLSPSVAAGVRSVRPSVRGPAGRRRAGAVNSRGWKPMVAIMARARARLNCSRSTRAGPKLFRKDQRTTTKLLAVLVLLCSGRDPATWRFFEYID